MAKYDKNNEEISWESDWKIQQVWYQTEAKIVISLDFPPNFQTLVSYYNKSRDIYMPTG